MYKKENFLERNLNKKIKKNQNFQHFVTFKLPNTSQFPSLHCCNKMNTTTRMQRESS